MEQVSEQPGLHTEILSWKTKKSTKNKKEPNKKARSYYCLEKREQFVAYVGILYNLVEYVSLLHLSFLLSYSFKMPSLYIFKFSGMLVFMTLKRENDNIWKAQCICFLWNKISNVTTTRGWLCMCMLSISKPVFSSLGKPAKNTARPSVALINSPYLVRVLAFYSWGCDSFDL